MQVLLNSDNNIRGDLRLTEIVEAEVERVLGRFADRVTRVEVHVNDVNSSEKKGVDDKRCQIEVRVRGLQPMSVSHHAGSLMEAITGAAEKMEKSLDRQLGRLDDD
ncbi:MAG: HPF/RaiA family ribosome-associated protein [Burkholderiales bacterium]|nr:HPF/RaiA family ribosome-associated protein [Burkholderiales bacterium]